MNEKPLFDFEEISTEDNHLSASLTEQNIVAIAPLAADRTRQVYNNGDDHYLYMYPAIYQGANTPGQSNNACWATSILSMVQYEKVAGYQTLTVQKIYQDAGLTYPTDGANTAESLTAIQRYLTNPYLPTEVGRKLTFSEIQTTVGNDDPAFMSLQNTSNSAGHAIVMVGYRGTSSSYNIWAMDPAYGQTVLAYTQPDGSLYISQGTRTFNWYNTIRFYYLV